MCDTNVKGGEMTIVRDPSGRGCGSISQLPGLLPELCVCADQKRISLIQGLGELSHSKWSCVAYKFGNRIALCL